VTPAAEAAAPAKIGLLGARGRMGLRVQALLGQEYASRAQLAATADYGDKFDALAACDAVIEFSAPEAAADLARALSARKGAIPALVVGSTGHAAETRKPIEELARRAPVVISSNYSIGVLALRHILGEAAPLLKKLGYTPSIIETHHRHKKDAPSGTAILLQGAISPGQPTAVQTHSVRAGEVIGDHEVAFYGPSDKIVLGHFAQNRDIFARGAIDVALWLASLRGKRTGLIPIQEYFDHVRNH